MFRKPTLEQRLNRLERLTRIFEAANSELIYQDDLWDVYKINSKEAASEGMTVLDNCMGSGSTGVACINTNRNFIGIELDDNYFQIADNRLKEAMELKNESNSTVI